MNCRRKNIPTKVAVHIKAFGDVREGIVISRDPSGRKIIARGQVSREKQKRQGAGAGAKRCGVLSGRLPGNTERFYARGENEKVDVLESSFQQQCDCGLAGD